MFLLALFLSCYLLWRPERSLLNSNNVTQEIRELIFTAHDSKSTPFFLTTQLLSGIPAGKMSEDYGIIFAIGYRVCVAENVVKKHP